MLAQLGNTRLSGRHVRRDGDRPDPVVSMMAQLGNPGCLDDADAMTGTITTVVMVTTIVPTGTPSW